MTTTIITTEPFPDLQAPILLGEAEIDQVSGGGGGAQAIPNTDGSITILFFKAII
jgi:hypothetical protein